MPVSHSVSRSGNAGNYSFTVIFHANRVNDDDLEFLRQNAKLLLEKQDLHGDGQTIFETSLFLRNGKVVAITRYQTRTGVNELPPPDAKFINGDFESWLNQLSQLIAILEDERH